MALHFLSQWRFLELLRLADHPPMVVEFIIILLRSVLIIFPINNKVHNLEHKKHPPMFPRISPHTTSGFQITPWEMQPKTRSSVGFRQLMTCPGKTLCRWSQPPQPAGSHSHYHAQASELAPVPRGHQGKASEVQLRHHAEAAPILHSCSGK